MRLRVLTYTTLLTLAVVALVPTAAEGVYLCVGDDFQVTVSHSNCGACCKADDETSVPANTPAIDAPAPECSPCVDVYLNGGAPARLTVSSIDASLLDAPLQATEPVTVASSLHPALFATSSDTLPASIGLLRSTVLII